MKKILSATLAVLMAATLCISLGVVADALTTTPQATKKALLFGDGYLSANDFGGMLYSFFENDGILLETSQAVYENVTSKTSTYNLYELFERNDITIGEPQKGTSRQKEFWYAVEQGPEIDYFIWRCPTEYIGRNNTWSNHKRQVNAFKRLIEEFKEHGHSNVKVILLVPHATGTTDEPWFTYNGVSAYSAEQQRSYINNLITSFEAVAKDQISLTVVRAEDGINSFNESAAGSDIELLDSITGRFPTMEGSYLNAALVYHAITGNSVYGMQDYCLLPEDVAVALQKEAHKVSFGSYPTYQSRTDNRVNGDLFPDYSGYDEALKPLMASAEAFYNRGSMFQYDQWSLDRNAKTYGRRELRASPEIATPQMVNYLDCSGFIASVFYDTYGYEIPQDITGPMMNSMTSYRVYHWVGGGSVSAETGAQQFKDNLQIGDVVVYLVDPGTDDQWGHTMLYVGDNKFVHSTGFKRAGGGSDYAHKYAATERFDKYEVTGTMRVDTMDVFASPYGSRYMFNANEEVCILRLPVNESMITDHAMARVSNLENIVSYKLTTVPYGQSVRPGEEVTFTFVVTNLGNTSKTVKITDVLPAGTVLVEAKGFTEYDGQLSRNLTVPSGETKEMSYTVKVLQNAETGQFIVSDSATIGGIPCNETHIYVSNALDAQQSNAVVQASSSVTFASSAKDYIDKVYSQSLGGSFSLLSGNATAEDILRDIFQADTWSEYLNRNFVMKTSTSEAKSMLVPGLVGGVAYRSKVGVDFADPSSKVEKGKPSGANGNSAEDAVLRIEWPNQDMLMVGDIILFETSLAYESSSKVVDASGKDFKVEMDKINAEMWIYCGNGIYKTYKDGAMQTISGTAGRALLDSLCGRSVFCVLRPAQSIPLPEPVKIWTFGGHMWGSYYVSNILEIMLNEGIYDGGAEVTQRHFSHTNTSASTWNAYELFAEAARSDPDNMTFASSTGAQNAKTELEGTAYDYVIIQAGRDITLNTQSVRYEQNVIAAVKLAKLAYAKNPNVKIIIVAPYAHNATWDDFTVDPVISDRKTHVYYINAEAERTCAAIKASGINNVQMISIGTLFEEYAGSYNMNPVYLYRDKDSETGRKNVGNRANERGAYLTAAALYQAITGDNVKNLNTLGYLGGKEVSWIDSAYKDYISQAVQAYFDAVPAASVGETVTGYNLILEGKEGGDIGMSFNFMLNQALKENENAYLEVTQEGKETEKLPFTGDLTPDSSGKVKFITYMPAKRMGDTVTVRVSDGTGFGASYTFSVQSYCEAVIETSADAYLRSLAVSLLNYGAAAQTQFGYNTENLVNKNLSNDNKALVEQCTEIGTDADRTVNGNNKPADVGIKSYEATLLLGSQTRVRYYFTFEDGVDPSTLSFSLNGLSSYTLQKKGSEYYIDVEGIEAKWLSSSQDGKLILKVEAQDGAYFTISYGPINYMARMYDAYSADESKADFVNLLRAMYLYGKAAATYFKY